MLQLIFCCTTCYAQIMKWVYMKTSYTFSSVVFFQTLVDPSEVRHRSVDVPAQTKPSQESASLLYYQLSSATLMSTVTSTHNADSLGK